MSKPKAQLKLEDDERKIGSWSERDYLSLLLEEVDAFCERVGVGKDIILETYAETSDWMFLIKVDALHETACRDVISRLAAAGERRTDIGEEVHARAAEIEVEGRDSLLRLVELMRGPKEYVRFLQCLKRVRDAFTHDIRSVDKGLADMVEALGDRVHLLSALPAIGQGGGVRDNPGLLRFGILHQSMALLCMVHAKVFADPVDDVETRKSESSGGAAPALRLIDSNDRPPSPSDSTGSHAALPSNSAMRPARFLRHSYAHPAKPNRVRPLWLQVFAFSAKGLVAISGLVAAIAVFVFFGIWPAIIVGALAILPVTLDKWRPGVWKGRCPYCDSQIAIASRAAAHPDFGCPVCAERIILRDKSFSTLASSSSGDGAPEAGRAAVCESKPSG